MARLEVPQVIRVRPSACMHMSRMDPECASMLLLTSVDRNFPSSIRKQPALKG